MSLIIKNRIQEFDVKEYYKKIYKGSKAEFMKKLEGEIEAGKKQCVVTANPEIFMLADRMKEVRGLLMAEDTTIVADGIGILIGGKKLGFHIKERIPPSP